ncbi:sigma-54-dependent Fis family transcriptional regulator [Shewanella dokdonensis]|uniref:Sigma-54-dependent Fis family transcriptional regulator n=1 Tax=Shewanella dokdonensis TaxID=712036 RepID=A0ABX8DHI8_9GAMM|nr:sigma-54-dependent Fis family transcriptional regulator [Shewanella dokdonensis]MCL1075902.1 sigma-54-dependent Fis family transcriptional regulator [Shewanella dokdonensis]QVK24224.1 sigma-54-dependent Fis family transcriptional regulator [Shewanella dokdonensis]
MENDGLSLKEMLTVSDESNSLHFLDQRVIVFDLASLALLRKELIDTLGFHGACAILTRFGYAHGWCTAKMLSQEFPDLVKQSHGGALLHRLFGEVNTIELKMSNGNDDEPLYECILKDSYEAEQHRLLYGKADEPACWTLMGYASGYESFKFGREVYFIEDKCVAKGDPYCRIRGNFKEKWGDKIKPYLEFYAMSSADIMLRDVSEKLRETERKLKQRQRQLGLLSRLNEDHHGMFVRSTEMQKVIDMAKRVAQVDSSVLITGESGVGKERISRYIHEASCRSLAPFITINCAALTETLLESELFGHAKGAFTDANRDRPGLFEEANGGTLFLDEVGELSPATQAKLLRVLQEKEVRRVGENRARHVNVRLLSATNRDLLQEVKNGNFREDLYYRLKVIEVKVPPLRHRSEDILPLANFFLRMYCEQMQRKINGFSTKVASMLLHYAWPGNVRELQNMVERAVVLCPNNQIDAEDLPPELLLPFGDNMSGNHLKSLAQVEREYVANVVTAVGGDKRLAAAKLGIGFSTLYKKLQQHQAARETA